MGEGEELLFDMMRRMWSRWMRTVVRRVLAGAYAEGCWCLAVAVHGRRCCCRSRRVGAWPQHARGLSMRR